MHPLLQALSKHFPWHPARQECFAMMIVGIIDSCKVHLKEMAYQLPGQATTSSKVHRIYRFLREQAIDYDTLFRFILSLISNSPVILTMDRSNWKFGTNEINILFLCVVVKSVSIPLCWLSLGRAGLCDTAQRKQLLQKAIDIIGHKNIRYFLADREFMGKDWLHYLHTQKIQYSIPLKSNTRITLGKKPLIRVDKAFPSLPQRHYVHRHGLLFAVPVLFAAYRNDQGELMVLVCSEDLGVEPFLLYKQRWTIERLFKHLKTGGFNMEDSHITKPERFDKLIAALAIAAVIVVKQGIIRHKNKPITVKKTLNRALYSVFTYGLDQLRAMIKAANKIFEHNLDNLLKSPIGYNNG